MAYFARPLIQMARTAAVVAPAARSYSVAVRQPLRAPVMLAAARPVLSPAAFVRAMGGGGGFIDAAEATARIIDVVSNFEKVRPADLLLARFCVFFVVGKRSPRPPSSLFLPGGGAAAP